MAGNEMTPSQATLYYDVYVPSWSEKLAELGRTFNSEDDLRVALETTALVKMATATQNQGVIKEANLRLKQLMGMDKLEARAAEQAAVKTASEAASQNPSVRQAILSNVLGNK